MPDPTPFDHPPRLALAAFTLDQLAAWHLRYCPQEGLEMRAWLVLETVEPHMREAGAEVTIRALWVELADRDGGREGGGGAGGDGDGAAGDLVPPELKDLRRVLDV